jgi:hypothetical protein
MGGMFKGGLTKQKLQDPYMAADRSAQQQLSQLMFGQMGITQTPGSSAKQPSTFSGSYTPSSLNLGPGWGDPTTGVAAGSSSGAGSSSSSNDPNDPSAQILAAAGPQISGLFNSGANQIQKTTSGAYLDPTQNPAWQSLSSALNNSGAMNYQNLLNTTRSDAARSGAFSSSARLAGENTAAAQVATSIADTLAKAGFAQYGAERGYQENAAKAGPDIVNQIGNLVNTMKQTKLKADQLRLAGATAQADIEDAKIKNMIQLLSVSQGKPYTQNTTTGNVRQFITDLNNGVSSWVGVGGGAAGSNGGFMGGK